MIEYSIFYRGSNDEKNVFFYSINGLDSRKILLQVFETFTGSLDYSEEMILSPGIGYWTGLPFRSKTRYAKFIDLESSEIVGLFSLDGVLDFNDYSILSKFKEIGKELTTQEKYNLSSVLNEIMIEKVYDNDFLKVSRGDVVVDIGFNMGIFSLDSLKYGPKKIIAFEPTPDLVNIYNSHFNFPEISLYPFAVSDKEEKIYFYQNYLSGLSSTIPSKADESHKKIEVDSIVLWNFLSSIGISEINFLKMDCEGAEIEIFDSMSDENLSKIEKMVVEFHYNLEHISELVERIKRCGFQVLIKENSENLIILYAKK